MFLYNIHFSSPITICFLKQNISLHLSTELHVAVHLPKDRALEVIFLDRV